MMNMRGYKFKIERLSGFRRQACIDPTVIVESELKDFGRMVKRASGNSRMRITNSQNSEFTNCGPNERERGIRELRNAKSEYEDPMAEMDSEKIDGQMNGQDLF